VRTKLREGERERTVKRYLALWSLRAYPTDPAIDALLRVAQGDYRDPIRADAVRVLARIPDPRAREEIEELLDHPNDAVREEAIYAVGRFLDAGALPRLVPLLRDPSGRIRQAARAAIEEIRFYLEQQRFAAASPEETALASLLEMLASPEPAVRLAAVGALAKIRDPRALEALVRARRDADAAVREAAERALDAWGDPGEQ